MFPCCEGVETIGSGARHCHASFAIAVSKSSHCRSPWNNYVVRIKRLSRFRESIHLCTSLPCIFNNPVHLQYFTSPLSAQPPYLHNALVGNHIAKTPQGLVCIPNNVSGSYIDQFTVASPHFFQIRQLRLYYQTSHPFRQHRHTTKKTHPPPRCLHQPLQTAPSNSPP
jgi:hypothetical protein